MKNIVNETKIIKWIILLPIIGVILTSFVLTNIFISSKHETHNQEIINFKQEHISKLKEKIKERIEHISILLDKNYQDQLNQSKNSIKDMVNIGHELLENIYQKYKHLPKEKIYEIINKRLKDIRFFDNKNGYYFVYDLETSISISLPSSPRFVGTPLKDITDKEGKKLFKTTSEIIKNKNEGFDTWYWNRPNSKEQIEKIGYIKKFAPLNIAIGTAVYIDDIKANIINKEIELIEGFKYDDKSYIFIMDTNGTAILHKNKTIIDIPVEKLPKNIRNNVFKILDSAINSDGTFLEYTQSKIHFNTLNEYKKISYVKHIPFLNWVMGTGLYTNVLEEQIREKTNKLNIALEEDIKTTLFVSSIVSLIIIILLIFLSKRINNLFQFYSHRLEDNNNKLKNLNNELEKKVKDQVASIREKDLMLNQQSKLAAMGEMLGNIAHQWRQPLSAISTIASGIRVQKEIGIDIDDKQLDKDLEGIVKSTIILSNTIEDFRNFYSQDKIKCNFFINHAIEQVLTLISANIKNKNIELILNIKDIEINSYENELVQVILNILNNAKDALIESEESNRLIFIDINKEDYSLIIKIYDNAGGINEEIIDRIFEPYFTTKFKSHGTGIGLYMTKSIIENSLDGEIKVVNTKFNHNKKPYIGALFTIKLPTG